MVRFTQFFKQTFAAVLATLLLFSLPISDQVSQAAHQERTYEVIKPNWPKGIIEIKQINNLQSTSFPQDFEVEIKNISDKPIYYIYIAAPLPETGMPPWGLRLEYGRRGLTPSKLAEEGDVPLKPGESTILVLGRPFRQDMFPRFKDNDAEYAWATRRVKLFFQYLSFGDGTGYHVSQPYPSKK